VLCIKKKDHQCTSGVSFVKAIIIEKKGCVVNWACFTKVQNMGARGNKNNKHNDNGGKK
jgi:hypothetical protein